MPPIPAAVYYRMSDDKQEHSIERQRSQVNPYATRNGFVIVREYLDEGIAGDEEGKRLGFMQMMDDAAKGIFKAILCDDKDRFGRFDSITYGYYVYQLRRANVWLETVAQGKIDWHSFAGRITNAALDEAKKLELQATSRRVITRMLMEAKQGKWQGGRSPYGYQAVPDDILGKRLAVVPEQAEAVRLMFQLVAERGYSLSGVVQEMHRRGYPPPEGNRRKCTPVNSPRCWQVTTIRGILRNRKYLGDMTWNVGHDGKYSELVNGVVNTSDSKIPQRSNREEDWIIRADTHEALIDRETFEKVQAVLAANKKDAARFVQREAYLLRGLLVCGNCGWRMIGQNQYGKRYYKCGLYHQAGRAACGCNQVLESRLVRGIVRRLQAAILDPEQLRLAREEVRKQEQQATQKAPKQLAKLRKEADALTSKVERGTAQLAIIPPDLVADVAAQVRGWKDQREALLGEVRNLEKQAEPVDIEQAIGEATELVGNLVEAVESSDPSFVRALLLELVSKIELHFKPVKRAKTTSDVFIRGVLWIRPQIDNPALAAILCNAASPIPDD